jgi:hypothetical protein
VLGGAKDAVGDAQQDRKAERVQANDRGARGVEAGGGQQRAGDQQAKQGRAAAGPGVQQRDGGGASTATRIDRLLACMVVF